MAGIHGTLWEAIALQRHKAGADPDAPPRRLALPAGWEPEAAAALAALAPGAGPVSLHRTAEAWIGRVISRAGQSGLIEPTEANAFAEGLRALLLTRRGAPGAEVWQGRRSTEPPRFVLNLPAFLEPEGGFDTEGYAEAVALGIRASPPWPGRKNPACASASPIWPGCSAALAWPMTPKRVAPRPRRWRR